MHLDQLNSILFANTRTQNALVQAIKCRGYAAADFNQASENLFNKVNEEDLQRILAPILRARTIQHLREASTPYTQAINEEYNTALGGLDTYEAGDAPDFNCFLAQQGQEYVYATDLEAGALADLLGVTFSCQQATPGTCQPIGTPYVYYRCAEEHAEIIHLNNVANDHFFVLPQQYNSTIGDGNCLYNGFAQIIRQLVRDNEPDLTKLYIEQQKIYEEIKNLTPTPIKALIERARAHKYTEEDKAACSIALSSPFSSEDKSCRTTLQATDENKMRLEKYIESIRQKAQLLSNRKHHEAAEAAYQLADTLRERVDEFFMLDDQSRNEQFCDFKRQCVSELEHSKKWAKEHRGYQQIFLNILQTLTVIGALLGLAQWSRTGNYSLFSPATKSLQLIEETQSNLNSFAMEIK